MGLTLGHVVDLCIAKYSPSHVSSKESITITQSGFLFRHDADGLILLTGSDLAYHLYSVGNCSFSAGCSAFPLIAFPFSTACINLSSLRTASSPI